MTQLTTNTARTSQVISVSLMPEMFKRMENARISSGQSRSSFITDLIARYTEDQRWQKIYQKGAETAEKFNITSESDIDKILHEA